MKYVYNFLIHAGSAETAKEGSQRYGLYALLGAKV
jgi:hypothetical protein